MMSREVQKNSFEKMCDKLEEDYTFNENEVMHVRKYIKSNIENDVDMLLKIKAEALEDDYSVFQSIKIAIVALVVTAIGTFYELLPVIENELASCAVRMVYLALIMFTIMKILKPQHFKTVSKWRKYVLVVIDEMLCEQKKTKDKKRKEKK